MKTFFNYWRLDQSSSNGDYAAVAAKAFYFIEMWYPGATGPLGLKSPVLLTAFQP